MDGGTNGGMGGGWMDSAFWGWLLWEKLSVGPWDPGYGIRALSALGLLMRSTETLWQLSALAGETWAEKAPGLTVGGSLRKPVWEGTFSSVWMGRESPLAHDHNNTRGHTNFC